MFELGIRLAFDKPTIIVKDDKTAYSFDTSNIEHLEYPRDLRFSKIVEFKKKLADKIAATYKKATTDATYTTFLKHFGEFTVAKLDKKEVSGQEYILEELRSLRSAVQNMERTPRNPIDRKRIKEGIVELCLEGLQLPPREVMREVARYPGVGSVSVRNEGDHLHVSAEFPGGVDSHMAQDGLLRRIDHLRKASRGTKSPAEPAPPGDEPPFSTGAPTGS
jgi:hypothetical protein